MTSSPTRPATRTTSARVQRFRQRQAREHETVLESPVAPDPGTAILSSRHFRTTGGDISQYERVISFQGIFRARSRRKARASKARRSNGLDIPDVQKNRTSARAAWLWRRMARCILWIGRRCSSGISASPARSEPRSSARAHLSDHVSEPSAAYAEEDRASRSSLPNCSKSMRTTCASARRSSSMRTPLRR